MSRRMIILSFLFFSGWIFIARASKTELVSIRQPLMEFPTQIDGWAGQQQPPLSDSILANLGVDDYLNRTYYSRDRRVVDFYVGYYQTQRQGKAIHSPLNCLPGAGFNPIRRGLLNISVQTPARNPADARTDSKRIIEVNRVVIAKGLDKQLVVYWYQSHGRVIASEYQGRIYSVLDAIRTNRTDAALVRVISSVGGLEAEAENEAERTAVDFVQSVFPRLDRYLPD